MVRLPKRRHACANRSSLLLLALPSNHFNFVISPAQQAVNYRTGKFPERKLGMAGDGNEVAVLELPSP